MGLDWCFWLVGVWVMLWVFVWLTHVLVAFGLVLIVACFAIGCFVACRLPLGCYVYCLLLFVSGRLLVVFV